MSIRFFRCPSCEYISCSKKWNEKTRGFFGSSIQKIGERTSTYCLYICPKCKATNPGVNIKEMDE